MTQIHIISDSITRLRNAQMTRNNVVYLYYSKLIINFLKLLKKQGYIVNYEEILLRAKVKLVRVLLKYNKQSNKPSITEIKVISKPSKRIYVQYKKIQSFYGGLGLVILSTSKGLLSDYEAKNKKVGGELICKIF